MGGAACCKQLGEDWVNSCCLQESECGQLVASYLDWMIGWLITEGGLLEMADDVQRNE